VGEFKPTNYGSMYGIPVLIDMRDDNCPGIEARYHLGWALSVMDFLFGCFCYLRTSVDPTFEPMFPILIKGDIK